MTVCTICENVHSDECSPSALKVRIDDARAHLIDADLRAEHARSTPRHVGQLFDPNDIANAIGVDRDYLRAALAVMDRVAVERDTIRARLAEAEVELLDLRSGKDRLIEALGATGEDRRWKWLIAAVWDLRRDLAEALATLANERGEGEPPVEGWTARPRGDLVRWVRFSARPGRTLDVVRQAGDEPGVVRCHWWDREIDKDGDVTATCAEGYAATFRAAMRAASERLRGSS